MAKYGPKPRTVEQRFWPKVQKSDGCWLWIGTKNNMGYGMIHSAEHGKKILAHRAAWELAYGPVPAGMVVMHGCDTPACVRHDHLKLGTQGGNMIEMVQKGRLPYVAPGQAHPKDRRGSPSVFRPRNRTPEQRFWAHVQKQDGDACWLWSGGKSVGYGCLRVSGKSVLAHRFSWEIHNGPIPAGLVACHKCDNPACVRPDHLFLGTQVENIKDMWLKGRGHAPDVKYGSAHHNAKLTEEQVQEARALYAAGGVTQTALAVRFNVSLPTMNHLVNGKVYKVS